MRKLIPMAAILIHGIAADGVDLKVLGQNDFCKNPTILNFEIINQGSKPLITTKGGTPWFNGSSGARFYAFRNKMNPIAIPQIYGIQSNFDQLEIFPGTPMLEAVDLAERFPDLGGLMGKEDIFVFWFYEFLDIENQKISGERFNGMISIPADFKNLCQAPK